ncbi:MAG: hypothetical protein HYY06_31465 [Deltaproteobacteria bacterium]|nr:hypothetical protein [Deltaproteobacteria bacterium]
MSSSAMLAAVVEPSDIGSAMDAWVLGRSIRPFVVVGVAPAHVRLLLVELGVGNRAAGSIVVARDLIAAGRASVRLYRDEDPCLRPRFGPDGHTAWPIDLRRFLVKLDGRVLRLAVEMTGSIAGAARLVGLPERTCHARLRRADRLT